MIKNKPIEEIENILKVSKKRDLKDLKISLRYYSLYMVECLWDVFGRILEPFI